MRKSRNPESGYALLFILMMAAVIAVTLYAQLPRVAFESQRDREQLLIDRGEQYKRAIQLYVRKFNRFPVDMQALENTQNIRFLRKQYIDPMTGKNEWRLIHVGANGALIDSKVSANPGKDKANAPDNFITELTPIGGGTNPNQGVNQATRRRPGDDPGSALGDPNNPGGAINGPVMVLPDGRIVPANSTGTAPTPSPQPGQPGQVLTGIQPGQTGQPGQPGQPALPSGFQQTPNAPAGGAAALINQILTTPRPGGFNGMGSSTAGPDPNSTLQPGGAATASLGGSATPGGNTGTALPGMGGTAVGGGIAGVASKFEQEGIKLYNQRSSYDEWEFIYDMSKDKTRGGGVPGQQTPAPGQTPAMPPTVPLTGKS
jgi:hypothetical protein